MAGDLKTQIAVGVDGSGVTSGVEGIKRKLSDLGKAASDTGKQAAAGIDGIGAAAAPAAFKVEAATKNMIGSLQRQIAVMEAGSKSGADYYRALAGQRGIDVGALKPYLDQLDQLSLKQKAVGVSAGQTAAAMRQVPAQFTDIVTSLQGGQNPLTVLLQQGGQLKDSFGGVGAASRALGGYVLGLANPFTVAAAAAAVLGAAAYKGSQEQTAYQRAIILSGNAAGVTAGQLDLMAASLKGIGAGTQGQAAEALAALAGTGQVGAANLQKFAATAIAVERTIGTSVADTAKAFGELADEPLKATEKLAKGTGYLTLALYDQIKALEDQGKKSEAAAVAQSAYDTAQAATAEKLKGNLGSLERLMKGITGTASSMWDSILGVGRQATPEIALSAAQKAVAALQATYDSRVSRGMATGDVQPQLEAAKAAVEAQSEIVRLSARAATAEGAALKTSREAVAARQANAKWAEAALTATEKTNRALEIYRANNAKIIADGGKLTASTIAAEEAAIRKANEGPKTAKPKAYQDDAGTKYLQDLREQEAAAMRRLVVGEKLTGAAKELAEFEQKIADIKGKGTLTKDQKDLLARQGEIRGLLQEIALLEKLGMIEDEEAKKKAKLAQEAIAFQDRAAQLQEQIASAQAERREGYGRALGAFGKSDFEQQRIQEINGLYRESLRLQDQLTKATPKSQLGSENYLAEIASIKSALGTSLADHATYYGELKRMQSDWSLGAQSALATYAEDSANVARQMQQAVGGAFKGMEDQLVSFVMTGKADFKSLANSIISDIVRITIRQSITGPLASALGGLFGGVTGGVTGSVAKNALGGVYESPSLSSYSNQVYDKPQLFAFAKGGVFAEEGPEAIMPLRRGADGRLGVAASGSNGSVEVHVHNNGAPVDAEVRQTPTEDGGVRIDILMREVKNMVASDIAAGGTIGRSIENRYGSRTASR
ncbi:phage tail tape measure protein [Variovorax sp. PvP013]|uniref:phage tail tape measure protein n=1 Tax=Variovorax sp. PvP013 TaxID=3156435 RepID=UPI003D256AF1